MNKEWLKTSQPVVRLLMAVASAMLEEGSEEQICLYASIQTAQANGDKETLLKRLNEVNELIGILSERIK